LLSRFGGSWSLLLAAGFLLRIISSMLRVMRAKSDYISETPKA
jgi:hypothetical protein